MNNAPALDLVTNSRTLSRHITLPRSMPGFGSMSAPVQFRYQLLMLSVNWRAVVSTAKGVRGIIIQGGSNNTPKGFQSPFSTSSLHRQISGKQHLLFTKLYSFWCFNTRKLWLIAWKSFKTKTDAVPGRFLIVKEEMVELEQAVCSV